MKKIFVVFKKTPEEIVNAYSLITEDIFLTIPSDQVQAKQELEVAEDKLFSSEEFAKMREDLLK